MKSFILKRFCITVSVIFALSFVWCINSVSVFGEDAKVLEVYSSFSSSGQIYILSDCNYKKILTRCGECIQKNKNFDYEKFLKDMDAKMQFVENVNGEISIYAYSARIKNFIKIREKKINIQVHIKKDVILLATPIIFGSF